MKKSPMHLIKSGNNLRVTFSHRKEVQQMPNLISIQKDSYVWFLKEGLTEVLKDISPIKDMTGNLRLDLVSCRLDTDSMKYDINECKERDATYAAPLRVLVRLEKKEKGELQEAEVYMGDLPLMTETGSFIVNGAERVVVSQMVRSPGIYYTFIRDKFGKPLYSATMIPNRGAWIEFECDSNDVFWVRVDRTRKVPITVLIRALGLGTDEEIFEVFGDEPKLRISMEKEPIEERNHDRGLIELYQKIRPGEQLSVDSAQSLFNSTLYDNKRYDLGRSGRYKFNKKLQFKYRVNGLTLADDVIDTETGEILAKKGEVLDAVKAEELQNSGVAFINVLINETNEKQKILSNLMVDINHYIKGVSKEEWENIGITELVYYPVLKELLEQNKSSKSNKEALLKLISKNSQELVPKHIVKEDIYAAINYCCHLDKGIGTVDDIDHLGNRRIRPVGELLQNQYRVGLTRLDRIVRERMVAFEVDEMTPQSLINIKPVQAAIKEFFGSSQLSQFMDQNNPLSEITHKRRLSALGPGGISRERAGFEVRDVHYTHYGRVCPIETPEGPNIGLINSLASYAKINKYGFIEAPYRKVDKSKDPTNPIVTNEIVYMTADEEDNYRVAQANEPLDEKGHFVNENVSGRYREETSLYRKDTIDYMDISPRMVFSVATSMIPFLQNDDANRALMGSNMQRQAVPLMITEGCAVGTGIENTVAVDSGVCVKAKEEGTVTYVDSLKIIVKNIKGDNDVYKLSKFLRSNTSNSYNQKPTVSLGEKVYKNQVIADGASTSKGELALGKNPLIGFMTWEGYNYEDAVLLSERLVREDVYTSIHIEEYEIDARETKLGPEEITNDVPGVNEDSLKDLNSDGIIRVGAEVRAGDILVGKVAPKGEQDLTAEERLLRAIFREKAKEVRDASLRLPHGAYGIVIGTRVFSRKNGDEVPAGVNYRVRVYVAQKRKISVGDKMAGRHGNKGVVSRVLPVEDMPYLPNGRPLDIVLNPLGVPSRMNIGQVMETHLSFASRLLGIDITTPTFEGATEDDIQETLLIANDYVNIEWNEFKNKYKDVLEKEVLDYLGSHLEHRDEWKGVHVGADGKVLLRDGRSGEYFDSPTTIGFMHYLKLHHLVDDKIHARSTGPYSLVTQQPLGGKAQFGGQRFGEMEVWALEAYGAAYTLQEILTVKSDDMVGRLKVYESIIKGENMPRPTVPESFKVLLKELQALCLDVTVLDKKDREILIRDDDFVDQKQEMKKVLNSDKEALALSKNEQFDATDGFTLQELQDGELVDLENDDSINFEGEDE